MKIIRMRIVIIITIIIIYLIFFEGIISKHTSNNSKSELSGCKYLELQEDNDSVLRYPLGLCNSIRKLSKQMYR
jgi:hypothetical protein